MISFCAASAFLTMSASSLVRLSSDGTIRTVGLRNLLAERLLFGPELFVLSDRVAAGFVCRDQVVNQRLRLTAGSLRGPQPVWIEAEHLDINHRASLTMAAHFSARAAETRSRHQNGHPC